MISTNATTPAPLTRPIQCRPVAGGASGVPLHIYPNDIFWVNKIIFKNFFQKNQLSTSDSRPKYTNLIVKLT